MLRSGWYDWGAVRLVPRRRKNTARPATRITAAKEPRTPPTIAPVCLCEFETWVELDVEDTTGGIIIVSFATLVEQIRFMIIRPRPGAWS
jgi:hypothetical protein